MRGINPSVEKLEEMTDEGHKEIRKVTQQLATRLGQYGFHGRLSLDLKVEIPDGGNQSMGACRVINLNFTGNL